MKSIIEIKAVLNAVAAVIEPKLGEMIRDCVADIKSNIGNQGVLARLSPREAGYCLEGKKLHAIKEVRTRLNCGLKEAKDLVEFWINQGDWQLRNML